MRRIDNFQRTELILKSVAAGVWEYNAVTNEVFYSEALKKDLGYSASELNNGTYEDFLSLVHPKDIEGLNKTFQSYLSGALEEYETELRLKTKQGNFKWFLSRGNAIWDDEGRVLYVVGIHIDINDKKLQEERALNIQNRFMQLFMEVNDIMLIVELDDKGFPKKLINANNAACKRLGYTRNELLDLSLYDLKPPEYHHEVNSNMLIDSLNPTSIESALLSRDGSVIPVEMYCYSLILEDKIVKLCILRDISERKRADDLLKKSELRYRTLIDLCPDAIIVSKNQKILYSNPAAAKMAGYPSPEALTGVPVGAIIGASNSEKAIEREKSIITDNTFSSIEYEIILENGESFYIESASNIIPYGEDTAVLSIIRDITERKKLEAELQAKAEDNEYLLKQSNEYDILKTEFFSNISHELKTPLNILLGAIQLIQQKQAEVECPSRCNKYIKIMKQNSYRLLRLVNNLIDITRIDSGYFNLDVCNCNIITVIEEITQSVSKYIESKGVQLVFSATVEELWMSCDLDKIERIMLNLLSNAVKFTNPGGSILVSISTLKDKVLISVKDTGIGIANEKQEIIFQRFRQADDLLSRKAEGSGIGLSLVKALVEAHDGAITLNSKLGEGSEFIVELPVKSLEIPCNDYTITSDYNDINIERIRIEFSDIYSLR